MEPKINVANPDAITYHTDELVFTILGGIRLEGLDRLRVTIRTEMVNRKFPHYLNNARPGSPADAPKPGPVQ